jgi:hypothetical protein
MIRLESFHFIEKKPDMWNEKARIIPLYSEKAGHVE